MLVPITYCDSSICGWYPSYNLHRECAQGIQYHPAEIQGQAKIETGPHEGLQTRNSLFDGCIFRRGNDGVSLTLTPHLWFGAGWLQTWLARCGLLRKTERFRSPTSKSIYIHRSLNGNWTHLGLLKKDPRSGCRSLLILGRINELSPRSFLSLLSKQSMSSHRPDVETAVHSEARSPSPTSHVDGALSAVWSAQTADNLCPPQGNWGDYCL